MALEIAATDVIKIILQFCKENSLTESFQAIQNECGVSLNTVESLEAFLGEVKAGRWDVVLPQLSGLRLPPALLANLYEHVVLECLELREAETAAALVHQSAPFRTMQKDEPARYRRLEHLCSGTLWNARDLYGDTPRDARRAELATALGAELVSVPPARLMTIVGQALKWQAQRQQGLLPAGAGFDLLRGSVAGARDEVEQWPTALDCTIRFGAKSHPEAASFSPDGMALATGSADGFVEIWDPATGKLRKDLVYQAEERFMMHDKSVLAIAWSADSELLASGSLDGKIKVWRLATGQNLRRYDSAHSQGVTHLAFGPDGTNILSASFDGLIRVHGIKSGRMLKEFRGHTSFVNCAVYAQGGARVVSASADGTLRLWDARSCDCLATLRPPGTNDLALDRVMLDPASPARVFVVGRCPSVFLMTLQGQVVRSFQVGEPGGTLAAEHGNDVVGSALSSRGAYLYCLTEAGDLHAYSTATGKLEHSMHVADKGAIGLAAHPHRNQTASWTDVGVLSLWRPE